jgi:hypothetical protein
MPPVGFEPTMLASEQSQTQGLHGLATGKASPVVLYVSNIGNEKPSIQMFVEFRDVSFE